MTTPEVGQGASLLGSYAWKLRRVGSVQSPIVVDGLCVNHDFLAESDLSPSSFMQGNPRK